MIEIMDNFYRRFFRDLLWNGLPIGAVVSIYIGIDYGVLPGIIGGSVLGLMYGLFSAYTNAKLLSKPVYPMAIDRSQFTATDVQTEFQHKMPSGYVISIWVGLTIILLVISILLSPDLKTMLYALYIIFIFFILFAYYLLRILSSRIDISHEGVEFRTMLYRIRLNWEEIERFEKRGSKWFLVHHSTKINSFPLLRNLLKLFEVDKKINLSNYTANFLESEIAKAFFYHARQIAVMSTG
jgi:hypothetical protein